MTDQPLDIEIYIKNIQLCDLNNWLSRFFELNSTELLKTNNEIDTLSPFSVHLKDLQANSSIELMITPRAAGKAYTSLWFKSAQTPWKTDLECSQSYLEIADTEVRCSSESWTETEEEKSEKWWKLTRTSQELVSWG